MKKSFLNLKHVPNSYLMPLFVASLLLTSQMTRAGDGHDHGEKPATQTTSLPRFVASSDQYELVGVIDGKKVTAYLDNSVSNEPVKNAKLSLELGGKPVEIKSTGDGVFEITLIEPLKPGVIAVSATMSAGTVTDLLAGEIDIHDDHANEAKPSGVFQTMMHYAPWLAGALAALVLLGVVLKRFAAKRKTRFS